MICAANGITVVVPPHAADRVPLVKSSAMTESSPGRLVEMAVRVDAAGQHQETARVDFASTSWKIDGERGDPAGAHSDVGSEHVGGSDRRSPSDDEIELRHSFLPPEAGC